MCKACHMVDSVKRNLASYSSVAIDTLESGTAHTETVEGGFRVYINRNVRGCAHSVLLLHELLHIALSHFERTTLQGEPLGALEVGRIAADCEVEAILERLGLLEAYDAAIEAAVGEGARGVTYERAGIPKGLAAELAVAMLRGEQGGTPCGGWTQTDEDPFNEILRRGTASRLREELGRAVKEATGADLEELGAGKQASSHQELWREEQPAPWAAALIRAVMRVNVQLGKTAELSRRKVEQGRSGRGSWLLPAPHIERRPVCFVVDVSGSMQTQQEVLAQAVSALDRLALSHDVYVVCCDVDIVATQQWKRGSMLTVSWGGTSLKRMAQAATEWRSRYPSGMVFLVSDLQDTYTDSVLQAFDVIVTNWSGAVSGFTLQSTVGEVRVWRR